MSGIFTASLLQRRAANTASEIVFSQTIRGRDAGVNKWRDARDEYIRCTQQPLDAFGETFVKFAGLAWMSAKQPIWWRYRQRERRGKRKVSAESSLSDDQCLSEMPIMATDFLLRTRLACDYTEIDFIKMPDVQGLRRRTYLLQCTQKEGGQSDPPMRQTISSQMATFEGETKSWIISAASAF
jgi:hypothetical protein